MKSTTVFDARVFIVDYGDEARASQTTDWQNADIVIALDGKLLKSRWTKTRWDDNFLKDEFRDFLLLRAARQMAFMASVIRCGSQLSEKEEAELTALQKQIREACHGV